MHIHAFCARDPRPKILLGSPGPFLPGETIAGDISMQHFVDPRTKITISLFGKAESKITKRSVTYVKHYHGVFNFFGPPSEQKVHEGDIHVPHRHEGLLPFTIVVPQKLSLESVKNGHGQHESWVMLDREDTESLPASFERKHHTLPGSVEAKVEYWLEVQILDCHGHTFTARESIRIRWPSSPLTTYFDIKNREARPGYVASYRLLPGRGGSSLSLGEKIKQLIGSSSVPEYAFNLEIATPAALQLENPYHVPFLVRAVPNWVNSTVSVIGFAQTLLVKKFKVFIESSTMILASSKSKVCKVCRAEGCERVCIMRYTRKKPAKVQMIGSQGYKPLPQDPSQAEQALDEDASIALSDSPPRSEPPGPDDLIVPFASGMQHLNLGRVLGLLPQPLSPCHKLEPSFVTYNIKLSHVLHWELTIEVAGEEIKLSHSHVVKLMGPDFEY